MPKKSDRQFTPRARKSSIAPPAADSAREVEDEEQEEREEREEREIAAATTPDHREALSALANAWTYAVRAPRRRAIVLGGLLVTTFAMLVARGGTTSARATAAGMLLAVLAAAYFARWFRLRVFRDPARVIEHVAGRSLPEESARAIRSLSLLDPSVTRGASTELAELHVARTLAALPVDNVRRGAQRVGFLLGLLALGFAGTNIAACATNPWGVLEGADVLVAQNGLAPIGMTWLDEPQIRARPPDYLHLEERLVVPYDDTALPRGTLLTMRGTPARAGRRLLLTDGTAEVPFVDDGSGHVVARWPLAESVSLRVVARFGDVTIPESEPTSIESIPDAAPIVLLEGAPKQIRLASEEHNADVPIHYEATDDHGLREVHLVLRAGTREERRVLARLDGETKTDRGGHNLRASDPFIKKSHAPIEIRVEAKDNDPITGPKWGASEAITLVPPDVGEPESRRRAALVKVRDKLVDDLAWRLATPLPAEPKDRREMLEKDVKLSEESVELLEAAVTTSYAGIRVPGRLGAMLRGRMRKVTDATTNQLRSPSTTARANVVKATERMVLVIDAAIQGLGLRDTRDAARELAEVADELAAAAALAQKTERARNETRMDAATIVLGGGGRAMRLLGALGRDIGEIVDVYLRRVARARAAQDLPHATLAAQDLAARLRQPDPSFGARGGRPSHAGGESGGGRGTEAGEGDGEPSDVEQAFNEAAKELDKLAGEHAGNMGKVEQSVANGTTKEDLEQLAEDAKKHAQKVRDSVKGLPNVGGGSDSWTSKGAAAKEHAEQMARALEQGNANDAVQSGKNALGALEEAKRAAQREKMTRGDSSAEKAVDEARQKLESEVRWAEEKLAELRRKASQRAAPELKEHGEQEGKLGERARDIARKGRDQDLPQGALDALRDAEDAAREAAQALKEGDAERGLKKQREAQQKLEQARDALSDDEGEGEGEGDGEGRADDGKKPSRDHTDIPKADAHKGPEEFRKRVIKGLGQPAGGKYKDAVKRYAEGLLR
ncbi:MAG: DUF4175 family protein [Labilithrix sp.]|nr:DUF4175 family protein [Labilithrix sp.]MCW5816919.1 DUF4175 family protein [Labilithrix sp.]